MRAFKLLKLIALFWRTSIAAESEYRLNFLVSLLTSLGTLAGGVFTVSLFFQQERALEGWSFEEAMVVLGVFTFLNGIATAVFVPNLNEIVTQVDKGTLDFVLVKPIDAQLWLSLRQFSLLGIPDIVLGVGAMAFGAKAFLTPSSMALFAISLLLSLAIFYALWFLLASTTLWFVKIYNITEVLKAMLDAGRLPRSAYPESFQFFFKFVIPIFAMTSVPAELLLRKSQPQSLVFPLIAATFFLVLARLVWNRARKSYTSASS